jgi:hypothetical protein
VARKKPQRTPQHLADKILISRVTLEGERKHVTVLFADIKGSMEFLADVDPEDAQSACATVEFAILIGCLSGRLMRSGRTERRRTGGAGCGGIVRAMPPAPRVTQLTPCVFSPRTSS